MRNRGSTTRSSATTTDRKTQNGTRTRATPIRLPSARTASAEQSSRPSTLRGGSPESATFVAQTAVHDIEIDVSGCTTQQQIRDNIAERVEGLGGFARLIVRGNVAPDIGFAESDLRDAMSAFSAVQIRLGALRTGYDVESLRVEPTVRGQFVADVLDAGLDSAEERRVLTAGLRALEGRRDLEVL